MKKRLLFYFHADVDSIQAQDRDIRVWSKYLNEDLFQIEIFCRNKPHRDFIRNNIKIHQLPKNRILRYIHRVLVTFIKKHDLIFFGYATDMELKVIKWLRFLSWGERPKIVYYLVNRFPYTNKDMSNKIIKLSHSQFAISDTIKDDVRRAYNREIPVVHLSYEKRVFQVWKPDNKRKKILSVGSLQFRKQPVLFFDLAFRLPEYDFYWIGTGELESIIRERLEKTATNNLFFLGKQSNEIVLEYMKICDLFVIPSIIEGFPNVIVEALSSSLPVLAYEDYGPEAIKNGYNGFIVNNLFELRDKINLILKNDEIHSQFKLNALVSSKKYLAENNIHEFSNYLLSVLNEH